MRRKDKQLIALTKKKKKFPFYGKVAGGNARSRPDRKVAKRQAGGPLPANYVIGAGPAAGPAASGGATVSPSSPSAPPAPASGGVAQPMIGGTPIPKTDPSMKMSSLGTPGEVPSVANYPSGDEVVGRAKLRHGGSVKRQDGGNISSSRRKPVPGESREPPSPIGPTEGMKDGGDTKWIGKARASMERRGTVGSLRKAMGAKEGQKIPTSSLQAKKAQAKRTGNTAMMRKVNFALNVRK